MGSRLSYLYLKVFFSVVHSYTHFDFFDLRKTKPSIHYSYGTKCNCSIYVLLMHYYTEKKHFREKKISNSHHSKMQNYKQDKICLQFLIRLFVSWNAMDDHTLQGRNWLPNAWWASNNAVCHHAKIWKGNCPPTTYAPALLQTRLWAWGHRDWSFDSHINPILTRGHISPTLYWCPHQVLKVTGAPVLVQCPNVSTTPITAMGCRLKKFVIEEWLAVSSS